MSTSSCTISFILANPTSKVPFPFLYAILVLGTSDTRPWAHSCLLLKRYCKTIFEGCMDALLLGAIQYLYSLLGQIFAPNHYAF